MESFVYKCPSCGGKVEYLNNQWCCSYCGGKYSSLFPSKEVKLSSIETNRYQLYLHTCSKCNKKTISESKNGTICSCGNRFIEEGKEFAASKVIYKDVGLKTAQNRYEDELDRTSKFPNKELYKKELKLQYFNCDLYKGCVKLSYKNHSEKIIFVNLLIPNIEYEDYKFMYEIGNVGISDSDILLESKSIVSNILDNGDYINSFIDKQCDDEIVKQCVNSFMKKHGIKDKKLIEVEKEFEVLDGVFVPIYTCDVTIDNEVYHQYVFGNSKICRFKRGIMKQRETSIVILELPKKNNALQKMKIYSLLYKILPILTFLCIFITLFLYLFKPDTVFLYDSSIILNTFIWLVIVIIIFMYISYKKSDFYEKSIYITKDDYYSQIINNSNYVKVIRRIK